MDLDKHVQRIETEQQQIRLDFIRTEIDLGFTFCESTRLSFQSDHIQHADQALTKAKKAWKGAEAALWQAKGATPAKRAEFVRRLDRLNDTIERVENLMGAAVKAEG